MITNNKYLPESKSALPSPSSSTRVRGLPQSSPSWSVSKSRIVWESDEETGFAKRVSRLITLKFDSILYEDEYITWVASTSGYIRRLRMTWSLIAIAMIVMMIMLLMEQRNTNVLVIASVSRGVLIFFCSVAIALSFLPSCQRRLISNIISLTILYVFGTCSVIEYYALATELTEGGSLVGVAMGVYIIAMNCFYSVTLGITTTPHLLGWGTLITFSCFIVSMGTGDSLLMAILKTILPIGGSVGIGFLASSRKEQLNRDIFLLEKYIAIKSHQVKVLLATQPPITLGIGRKVLYEKEKKKKSHVVFAAGTKTSRSASLSVIEQAGMPGQILPHSKTSTGSIEMIGRTRSFSLAPIPLMKKGMNRSGSAEDILKKIRSNRKDSVKPAESMLRVTGTLDGLRSQSRNEMDWISLRFMNNPQLEPVFRERYLSSGAKRFPLVALVLCVGEILCLFQDAFLAYGIWWIIAILRYAVVVPITILMDLMWMKSSWLKLHSSAATLVLMLLSVDGIANGIIFALVVQHSGTGVESDVYFATLVRWYWLSVAFTNMHFLRHHLLYLLFTVGLLYVGPVIIFAGFSAFVITLTKIGYLLLISGGFCLIFARNCEWNYREWYLMACEAKRLKKQLQR